MIPLPPLFADVNPVGIILVIIFVISLISQIVAKLHEKVQEAAKEAERRARAAQRAAAARNEQVDNEIGEFLRRTSGRANEPQGRPQPQQQAPQPPVPQRRPDAQRPFTPPAKPAFAPPPLPSTQEAVAAEVVAGAGVNEHVRRSLSASKLGQLGPQLQSKVEMTDERMEQHLHQAFEHRLGDLKARPAERLTQTTPTDASLGALALVAMLRDPAGARQAILLNEILSRPEHRWS